MRADLRLAWHLMRGSDRHEWWRIALTCVGALLATALAQGAAVPASVRGHHEFSVAHGLLNDPGERSGVVAALLLLETALPLAPGVLLAGIGGGAIGLWYATLAEGGGWSAPWAVLLVPVAVYAASLLAAATALPLLHRTVRPSELRYA
ncbi:hypothetical protein ACPC27_26940 [Streptomyces cellulosae]